MTILSYLAQSFHLLTLVWLGLYTHSSFWVIVTIMYQLGLFITPEYDQLTGQHYRVMGMVSQMMLVSDVTLRKEIVIPYFLLLSKLGVLFMYSWYVLAETAQYWKRPHRRTLYDSIYRYLA